jgi:peptidoglycan/LPS O-acetylase OafA/YrhL
LAGRPPRSARRALLAVLAAITVYLLVDLLVGVRYTAEDAVLLVSDLVAFALQAVLVLLVWQRRRWAWIAGAVFALLSAVGAIAMVADPTVGGYDPDAPRALVSAQALLLIAAAAVWFLPSVRPPRRRRADP